MALLVAMLALLVQYGSNVTLVHARKWFNGESCVNDGNVGSNSSTVAAIVQQWLQCLMIVEFVAVIPVVAAFEVVTRVEVVSMGGNGGRSSCVCNAGRVSW